MTNNNERLTAYLFLLDDTEHDEPVVLIYEYNDAMSILNKADYYLESMDDVPAWCEAHPGLYLTDHPFFDTFEEHDSVDALEWALLKIWSRRDNA